MRLRVALAGATRFPFADTAVRRLHQLSGGVPRLLNVLGERSLLAGYVQGRDSIDTALVDLAASEVLPPAAAPRWRLLGWSLGLGAAAALVLWWSLSSRGLF